MAISPGGRPADNSPLARPGYTGPRKTDDYTREVAHALMRNHGWPKGKAIRIARGSIARWSRGGGHVRPQVRAAAAASVNHQAALDHNGRGKRR